MADLRLTHAERKANVVTERRKFDVGIVVSLKEEFRYVVEIAPQLESIPHEGTYLYRLDFGSISAVSCLVDQMGPIPALQAATRLLGFADIKLLVVLGLGVDRGGGHEKIGERNGDMLLILREAGLLRERRANRGKNRMAWRR